MPSRLASDEEHLVLIEAMGQSGRGVYMVTKGAQMPVALLEQMAARARRPVMIAALLHTAPTPTRCSPTSMPSAPPTSAATD